MAANSIFQADMSSPETLEPAIAGSHTVFIVTDYWGSASGSAETEITQGKAAADACKVTGVQHTIFSSLRRISDLTGGRPAHIAHFDSKAAIEDYIRGLGIPATFVLLGWYMENFFQLLVKENGGYVWKVPIDGDKAQLPLIDAGGDTGRLLQRTLATRTLCLLS